MKKILALLLATLMLVAMVACGGPEDTTEPTVTDDPVTPTVMTYAEYAAAEVSTLVTIEAYVQATQSWWNNEITVYTQDKDGAYFLYKLACSEEDSAKLVPGTKIRVTGDKTIWDGEIEITDGTFEFIEGADTYIAEPIDATDLLGTEELINYQNQFATFKGMTVEASMDAAGNEHTFLYSWDGSGAEGTDCDLYFSASANGQTYTFVVEYYLCNENTDVYKAVQNLQVGDKLDLEGFLYWYQGVQPHITAITVVE